MQHDAAALEQADRKKAIVVLGSPLGGVSIVARAISWCVAQHADVAPAGEINDSALRSPQALEALNSEILISLAPAWDSIFGERHRYVRSNADHLYRQRAADFIRDEMNTAGVLVLGDAPLSGLTQFWNDILEGQNYEPTYVIVVRHPLNSAREFATGEDVTFQQGLLLWLKSMLAIERDTRGAKRLFIRYDNFLTDWRAELARIEPVLTEQLLPSRDGGEHVVNAFVSEQLRFDTRAANQPGNPDIWSQIGVAYNWFLTAARGDAPPQPEEIDAVRGRFLEISRLMGPAVSSLEGRLHRLSAALDERDKTVLRQNLALDRAKICAAEALAEQLAYQRHLERLGLFEEAEARRPELTTSNALSIAGAEPSVNSKEVSALRGAVADLAPQIAVLRLENASLAAELRLLRISDERPANKVRAANRVDAESYVEAVDQFAFQLESLRAELATCQTERATLIHERRNILSSTSWKLTALPRGLFGRIRRVVEF